MAKPTIAVFKFSSCAGCQLELLNVEDRLLDIIGAVDFRYFVMAKREKFAGPYDIGFVEGAVTTPQEVIELKKIRKECKFLVAMGACACTGGLLSIKNFIGTQREVEEVVYTELWDIKSIPCHGIDYYVKVDEYLRGCPICIGEMVYLLQCLLKGVKPHIKLHSVCNECKLKENGCLLLQGKPCMGPVTAAGCGALCPSLNRPCEGCRGPSNDANAASLARTFLELGLSKEDVIRKFRKYAGNRPEFNKGVEALL